MNRKERRREKKEHEGREKYKNMKMWMRKGGKWKNGGERRRNMKGKKYLRRGGKAGAKFISNVAGSCRLGRACLMIYGLFKFYI